ncbi:MAG: PDZ domain-containing protein, partial [Candidatus Cloacimonadota bacterium]|nr:PDZ domain-containing protein [Candidatus Cloacimonadota bacterium]
LLASTKAYIGVVLSELDRDEYGNYELKKPHGIKIDSIAENSPAEKEKLKEGDLILEIEENEIYTIDQLHKILEFQKPGDKVKLKILHNGKIKTKKIVLGKINDPKIKAYLGVYLDEISKNNKVEIQISRVVAGSPADKGGIEDNDFLTKLNEVKIFTVSQFTKMLNLLNPGDNVAIEVKRDAKPLHFNIELGSKKKDPFDITRFSKNFNNFNFPENVFVYKYDKSKWIGVTLSVKKEIKKTTKAGKSFEEIDIITKIDGVIPGSPAEEAELQKGDFVLKIDGKNITEDYDISSIIKNKKVGDTIELEILRDNKQIIKVVTIAARDSESTKLDVSFDNGELKIQIDGLDQDFIQLKDKLEKLKEDLGSTEKLRKLKNMKVMILDEKKDKIKEIIDEIDNKYDIDIEVNEDNVH